jgi:beta-glucosidase
VSEETLQALAAQLPLEDRVRLLSGRDLWSTQPLPAIGLRSMTLSDGPNGVRGPRWDERDPSLCLPSPTTLASTWDPVLVRRAGAVLASEARRKGVDAILAPTINLHRSPRGGRHFEAFSEDPRLSGVLAAAFVEGAQATGIGSTLKHYVANDSENERMTLDAIVGEQALHEVYLLPFQIAVAHAAPWLVMSAYNGVNGATMTESPLLTRPLTADWGFDGVVVSDWTAVRSINSARHPQDLAMPGPDGAWGDTLLAAVRAGDIDEALIDAKVIRLLRLAARVGALESVPPAVPVPPPAESGRALARTLAASGTVLVRNEGGELPWEASTLRRVAVIGQYARSALIQGGGSATVLPEVVVSPLDGLRAALPDVDVRFSLGGVVQEGVVELPRTAIRSPVTGEAGAHVRLMAADGTELLAEERGSTGLRYLGGAAPVGDAHVLELHTVYTPEESGEVRLGIAGVGRFRIHLDCAPWQELEAYPDVFGVGTVMFSPPSVSARLHLEAGVPLDIRVEYEIPEQCRISHALSITLGLDTVDDGGDGALADAVENAREADVALVVVGTGPSVESEGIDRTSLAMPGRQNDLVRAVVAVNPRTVVLVNAGAPVILPWRDEVAAVLIGYFGGQEMGAALGDVLLGRTEPGGRLTTTWPAAEADVPVLETNPRDGALRYDEGIHIGYRAWLRAGTTPAYEFGWGLGYTDWELGAATACWRDPQTAEVEVRLRNVGSRRGRQVVQVYAERADSAVERPARWLVGFAGAELEPGESCLATIEVPRHALAHWDQNVGAWRVEPGVFSLRIGTSVGQLPFTVELEADATSPHPRR